MKKFVFYLMIVLLMVALIGCGGNAETDSKVESDTETDNTPATETEVPETKEHVHEIVVDEEPATCSTRGLRKEYCASCGEVLSEEATPKLKHTATDAADCTKDVICAHCGEVMEPAKGHSWGESERTEATCLENGKESKSCTVCGAVEEVTIPMLDHEIPAENVTNIVASTCTEQGTVTGTCALCGKVQTNRLPLAHVVTDFGDMTKLTMVDGVLQGKCGSCGKQVDVTEEIRLQLDFNAEDVDLATELAKWSTTENGLEYVSKTSDVFAYVTKGNGATVLRQNKAASGSSFIDYNHNLLSDASYYVISFDWRITKDANGTGMVAVFGAAHRKSDGSANFRTNVAKIDRASLLVTDGGTTSYFTAEKDRWYSFKIVVNNTDGKAYVYIDGTYYKTVSDGFLISEAKQNSNGGKFSWRMAEYSMALSPEFDNFKVSVIK